MNHLTSKARFYLRTHNDVVSKDYGHANLRRYIFVKAAPLTFRLHKFCASSLRHPNWLYQFEADMKTVNKQSMLAWSELLETLSTSIHLSVICLRGERECSDWSLFSDENVSTSRLGNYFGNSNVGLVREMGWQCLSIVFEAFHSFSQLLFTEPQSLQRICCMRVHAWKLLPQAKVDHVRIWHTFINAQKV